MPDKKSKIKLRLTGKPEEGTRTVFQKNPASPNLDPFFKGDGSCNYVCGASLCNQVLAEGVELAQVTQIVFECPKCGKYSQC